MAEKKKKEKVIKKEKKIGFANVTQNFKAKKRNDTAVVMKKDKKKGEKKPRKKRHIILISLMVILIIGALSCLSFCVYIIATAPEFEPEKLATASSTNVYDAKGNLIAQLGTEKRENVTYDELPEVLIDAIIATEDSKFFEHSGIDLLRFSKAVLGQLLGHDDAGGGSTITMQLAKKAYSKSETDGIAGIIRKFKDIYMALFKIEKTYSKQEILEFYVNRNYFGSSAYGVEQAAQTYFNKSVGELNLAEAATIAGLLQAPDAYDAYRFTDKAQARRNLVLGLMTRHGYITSEEAQAAASIPLKDMLSGHEQVYTKYRGFIDTMYYDVIAKTGNNPALVSMNIYTTLDPDRQDVIDQIYDGTLYKWWNDAVQAGIAITDVHTGALVAVGTGRNRNALGYNYATQINRHPGSIAKPIFDYGPAIEYQGWGSGTFVMDDVYSYSNGQSITNVDGGYYGIMNAKNALAHSRNIPALQAFQTTTQEQKYNFVTGLGVTPELHNKEILESSSIGAFNGVSPYVMSAAYGAFARGGYYIEPYTFTKIEYPDNDNETYVYTPARTKVMSEETAYIVNYMLTYACNSGLVGGCGGVSGSDIATKTGTSSEDLNIIRSQGLPYTTVKDSWQIVYSPDYSMALWYGYDTNTKKHYLTEYEGWTTRRQISSIITPRIMKKNSTWSKPSGVVGVDIETGTNMLATANTPSNMRSVEFYRKGTEPTEYSPRFETLENVSNLTYTTNGNQVRLSWDEIPTPDAIDEDYLKSFFDENYGRWSQKYYNQRIDYNNRNIGTVIYEIYLKTDNGLVAIGQTASNSFTTSITNSTSASFIVKSSYTIFKDSASSGVQINVRFSSGEDPTPPSGSDDEGNDDDNQNDDDSSDNTSDDPEQNDEN